MKIVNKTKKAILTEKTEVARSFWRKALGLMFRGGIQDTAGFLLEFGKEGTFGIWMLGMRFPIDIVFIDAGKRVVNIFRGIKPVGLDPSSWRVYNPKKPSRWILEIRSGRAEKIGMRIGDRLSW